MKVENFNATLKDCYPQPGERIKQWVVDLRREFAWERETCPRVEMHEHDDNTGITCRNAYGANWSDLAHDCCEVCCDLHDKLADRADIVAWLEEKLQRPPIERDKSKLSDEIAPDLSLGEHPILGMVRK